MKDISKSDFDSEVLGAAGLLMVYYYAPWCKPCEKMTEVVETVADEVSEKMDIVQVNTDREGELVAQQKIRVIPSFQVFKAGQLLTTFRGPHSKLELLGQLGNIITEEGNAAESASSQ